MVWLKSITKRASLVGLINNITLLTKTDISVHNRNNVPTKGAECKFLYTLETSKKLFFSSSEGGNLVVRLRRISLLEKKIIF